MQSTDTLHYLNLRRRDDEKMTSGKADFLPGKPKPRCAPAIIDKSQRKRAYAIPESRK
jgi:hypothetical protein